MATSDDDESISKEYYELKFELQDGDYFTVDADMVEVSEADASGDFRGDTVKKWTISDDGIHSRELTEDEVKTVMPVVKDEYRDSDMDEDDNLPALR